MTKEGTISYFNHVIVNYKITYKMNISCNAFNKNSFLKLFVFLLLYFIRVQGTLQNDNSELVQDEEKIRVNKCCEKFEILLDLTCNNANESQTAILKPSFTNYEGKTNIKINYKFIVGIPACGSMQIWPIYDYSEGPDKLILLNDGKLRHYTKTITEESEESSVHDDDNNNKEPLFYDYNPGQYCLEKAVTENGQHKEFMFAMVCLPEKNIPWTETDFILRKIINPLFHVIAMIILLIISIIYFILPTLRDLVGNIITTITMCLLVSQAADVVRIFTEFSNHVSFFLADTILYVSLLGAFFWLTSLGYYIWKTFRSRNVFLRVTDGRKYCWYSGFVWGAIGVMAALAILSHYFLDSTIYRKQHIIEDQETIGWLGITIFFTPIAITILANVFFYVTTMKLLNRRHVYGRIQHKLKSNFIMYALLCLIMTISWIFLILSWFNHGGLLYTHILVNAMQAPLILYICIFRQKHVTFLLKKSCCYNEQPATIDWGDEMNYIAGSDY